MMTESLPSCKSAVMVRVSFNVVTSPASLYLQYTLLLIPQSMVEHPAMQNSINKSANKACL